MFGKIIQTEKYGETVKYKENITGQILQFSPGHVCKLRFEVNTFDRSPLTSNVLFL